MTQPSKVALTLGITKCKCNSFTLTAFGEKNLNPIPNDKFKFNFVFNFIVDEPTKTASIVVKSVLSFVDTNQDIAQLESQNDFLIDNFDQIAIKTEPQTQLPQQILIPMFSVSLSNLRGMYAIKLENTLYSNAILPLIDANQILAQPMTAVG